MSKSLDNAIGLADDPDQIVAKVRSFLTDPQKIRMGDPGRPEICPIFALHQVLSPLEHVDEVAIGCRAGTLGCVDDKMDLAERIIETFRPFRERRADLDKDPGHLERVLQEGESRARPVAIATLDAVRAAMHLA
jgi:tryptophanyl-tRNA synthetase